MAEVIELTIDPNYCRSWNVWESLRELCQNFLDARDAGFDGNVTRDKDCISFENRGTRLERSALLLGATSKADDVRARGQYGEGLKLAVSVLCRLGYDVRIHTGQELWIPKIQHSRTFGRDVLKIECGRAARTNNVKIDVYGISESDWGRFAERILWLTPPDPKHVINVDGNLILTDPLHVNKLYSKGIYVAEMPDVCKFGYDLLGLDLDRDRRLADPYTLRAQLAGVLERAVKAGSISAADTYELLKADSGESLATYYCTMPGITVKNALTAAVTKEWTQRYGTDTVPVTYHTELQEAARHSMPAYLTSKAIRNAVECELGTFDDRRRTPRLDVVKRYTTIEYTDAEEANMRWAVELVTRFDTEIKSVTMVDFASDAVAGMYLDGDILIARRVVLDRVELISTLVHEAAHKYGIDGTDEHHYAVERLFGSIIARCVS